MRQKLRMLLIMFFVFATMPVCVVWAGNSDWTGTVAEVTPPLQPGTTSESDETQDEEIMLQGSCGANLEWACYRSGELVITGSGAMNDYSKDGAPWPIGFVSSITLPEGLTSIGDYAFAQCETLNSITLPEGLTNIGDYAFSWCWNLKEVTFPQSLTSIGKHAFGCCDLNSIVLPEGIESIADETFRDCKNLSSVYLPQSLTSIGSWAFSFCYNLKSINLPEGMTGISDYAFRCCNSLDNVVLPRSLSNIGAGILMHCKSLTKITLPENLTSIVDEMFLGCTSLVSIDLPKNISNIGKFAFSECSSLESIDLPKGLTYIANRAFEMCTSLRTMKMNGNAPECVGEVFYECPKNLTFHIPKGAKGYNAVPWKNFKVVVDKAEEPEEEEKPKEPEKEEKKEQTITVRKTSYEKIYGNSPFKLNASAYGKLTYSSSETSVAKVSKNGKVTIVGCGKSVITIKAAATDEFKMATKKITVTVNPGKVKTEKLTSPKKGQVKVTWKKDKMVTGYEIQYSGSSSFPVGDTETVQVKKSSKDSSTLKNLPRKTKCYVRIRSYKTWEGEKLYGAWSEVKEIKVK